MQERKWKVGGKYRLVDVAGFIDSASSNTEIAEVLGHKVFTVQSVNHTGKTVETIEGYLTENFSWDYWFNGFEIKFFEEITEQSPTQDNTSVVVEWLNKLEHVLVKDPTVGYGLLLDSEDTLTLSTDFVDLIGSEEIVEFINNRYSQLIEQANKSKREELLAEIVKAKEAYEKLVGELSELEGK